MQHTKFMCHQASIYVGLMFSEPGSKGKNRVATDLSKNIWLPSVIAARLQVIFYMYKNKHQIPSCILEKKKIQVAIKNSFVP